MMKCWIALFTILALTVCGLGAAAEPANEFELAAQAGRAALLETWRETYADDMYEGHSGYLEIKNTRVLRISDNPVSNALESTDEIAKEYFGDVAYVVEFVIYTDYMLTEPYYGWDGINDCVMIHRNGTATVGRNPFWTYRSRTYCTDFTGIIDEIEDLGTLCNEVFFLRQ